MIKCLMHCPTPQLAENEGRTKISCITSYLMEPQSRCSAACMSSCPNKHTPGTSFCTVHHTHKEHRTLTHTHTQVHLVLHPSSSDGGLSLTTHGKNRVRLRRLAYISTPCPKSALPSLDSCTISEADFDKAMVHLTEPAV